MRTLKFEPTKRAKTHVLQPENGGSGVTTKEALLTKLGALPLSLLGAPNGVSITNAVYPPNTKPTTYDNTSWEKLTTGVIQLPKLEYYPNISSLPKLQKVNIKGGIFFSPGSYVTFNVTNFDSFTKYTFKKGNTALDFDEDEGVVSGFVETIGLYWFSINNSIYDFEVGKGTYSKRA